MKKRTIVILSGLILLVLAGLVALHFTRGHTFTQGAAQEDGAKTQTITEDNLPFVCDALKSGGLSNVEVFEQWVRAGLKADAAAEDAAGFSDANCRMTVMLLAGDSIRYDSAMEHYDGTYMMFDMQAIDNQEDFRILKDKKSLFTTLFGEMPVGKSGFAASFADNLKRYGITFHGEKFSVISILFKTYEGDFAFVGHTGILVDCRENESAAARYLFVEKIAFGEPFTFTLVKDEKELVDLLSRRPDYSVEEGEAAPAVYKDGELIGELTRPAPLP